MGRLLRFLLPLIMAIALPAVAMAQTIEGIRPDDRTVGSAAAPVSLVVYLSATCPHCASWHEEEFPAFRAKYVDTGQVRVAFRDLPTPPQELAVVGAVMARCVPEDRYDEALSALFKGQQAVRDSQGSRPTVIAWLTAAGRAGGLTPEQMNACVSDEAAFDAIVARANEASEAGVTTTPSFFLNGQRVLDGAQPSRGLTAFDPLIQPLLAGR